MPKATKVQEDEYRLPAETLFTAVLDSVSVKTIEYTLKKDRGTKKAGEKDSFDKWIWEFRITDGPHKGEIAYGETEDRLTNREDNLVRQWGETLLGREIELGEEFDTDNILGLPCQVTVRHEEPRQKKDGSGFFYGCPVDEVFPVGEAADFTPF